MEVPDPAVNTELQLCISFESSTNSDRIVVLAHQADDPTILLAYSPPDNECFGAPTAGSYIFGVFTQNSDDDLEAPATPLEILIRTVSICKLSLHLLCFLALMSMVILQSASLPPIHAAAPVPSTTPTVSMTNPVPSPVGAIAAVSIVVVIVAAGD